ncbi:MAG: cadmium-translocating P-type ATPase [Clostridiales Family XIII bacterium]|jgi:Cd2+/Zn2+-exporting ATPase|nr:cadmium-translocating P-type ATPase [Clostridiales Family XIII bacterium]
MSKSCSCCNPSEAKLDHHDEHSHDHDHGHDHSHEHGESEGNKQIYQLIIAAIFFAAGLVLNAFDLLTPLLEIAIFLVAYLIAGYEVILNAAKNILHGQVFDENFLMSIASIGAFVIGEYPEGVAVMLFYMIGEIFQDRAVDRSRKSIEDLMDIRPDYANLVVGKPENGNTKKVDPSEVSKGDLIVVKPGERIPLDGIIVSGNTEIDSSALTGESLPVEATKGSDIFSGSINISGLITVEVTSIFSESTVAKILTLVESATAQKAKPENFITKFARVYTPIVVILAVLLAFVPPLFLGWSELSDWVYRALIFLVVSCPCALVVSVPLSYFGGIGSASRQGILIKGGNYLEALTKVDTIVFDKTGTLTQGKLSVNGIITADGVSEEELLEAASYAESSSTHPIAKAIVAYYLQTGKQLDGSRIENYEEVSGKGIVLKIGGKTVLSGNEKLMNDHGIVISNEGNFDGTAVHVAKADRYLGRVILRDEVKKDSKQAIAGLMKLGVRRIAMFTGDNKNVAKAVAEDLGINENNVYAELLPQDKVETLKKFAGEKAEDSKSSLVFVGDGINDAPVLAIADVGIAMGAMGSDAAIEAADVVLMTDEPSKLLNAVRISRKTHAIVIQNIVFALGVKGVLLVLGALGLASMWAAVFGDVGVAFIAVLNAMRALKA